MLCLKARPTDAQLRDRLRPVDGVRADGLELYLDAADLATPAAIEGAVARIEACGLPSDFALLIEGPVGSLDGAFFDVTRDAPADRLVVQRLADLARRIGAAAVNIHLIAPGDDPSGLTLAWRDTLLARAVPFLRRFVEVTRAAGAVPTIENMPPVLRMRRGGTFFTPIGLASQDLLWAVDRVPGLAILPDTSHAGLYLNARAGAVGDAAGQPWLPALQSYLALLPPEAPDLTGFLRSLEPHLVNAQVSNAAGILGEGLPYGEGDFDLDPAIQWLGQRARHLVTETLEPDQDDAQYMRDALRHMRAALGRATVPV